MTMGEMKYWLAHSMDNDGALRGEYRGEASVNDLALADGNGDGLKEVIIGAGGYFSPGGVYVVDVVTGAIRGSYEVPDWVSALDVADMDGDGRDDIVAASGRGVVFLLGWTME
jgi:hypothetical protein